MSVTNLNYIFPKKLETCQGFHHDIFNRITFQMIRMTEY